MLPNFPLPSNFAIQESAQHKVSADQEGQGGEGQESQESEDQEHEHLERETQVCACAGELMFGNAKIRPFLFRKRMLLCPVVVLRTFICSHAQQCCVVLLFAHCRRTAMAGCMLRWVVGKMAWRPV